MKNQMHEEYKTEEQLKREAKARRELEASLAEKKPKSEGRKKRENFWYHYKWHTLAGLLAAALLAFFFNDVVFRENPDITVIMVSGEAFSQESLDALEHAVGQAAGDINGDGKAVALIDYISLAPGFQDYAGDMKLTAVLAAAADPVYLLDESTFGELLRFGGEEDVFEEVTASANNLGVGDFGGMTFYLRKRESFAKRAEYYELCESFILNLGGDK